MLAEPGGGESMSTVAGEQTGWRNGVDKHKAH